MRAKTQYLLQKMNILLVFSVKRSITQVIQNLKQLIAHQEIETLLIFIRHLF